MKRLAGLLPLLALVLTAASGQPGKNLQALKGKIVPDFQLLDLNGRVVKFSQFRGKVVLMNFWSPY